MKDFGSLLLVYLLLASQASCHMMRGNDHHHMMGKMDSEDMMGHDGSMMMGKGQMMEHCPFRIQIDGKDVDDGTCFESPNSEGVLATIVTSSPQTMSEILIWDTETKCQNENESYIHFAGEPTGVMRLAMTADLGDENEVHTYQAALFDKLPVPEGTTGCYAVRKGCKMMGAGMKWRIARHEASCEEGFS